MQTATVLTSWKPIQRNRDDVMMDEKLVVVAVAEIVAVAEQGLGSVRSVEAFDRQDLEAQRMDEASQATVQAALKARRIKSDKSEEEVAASELAIGDIIRIRPGDNVTITPRLRDHANRTTSLS